MPKEIKVSAEVFRIIESELRKEGVYEWDNGGLILRDIRVVEDLSTPSPPTFGLFA